jgi:hypothetical protein
MINRGPGFLVGRMIRLPGVHIGASALRLEEEEEGQQTVLLPPHPLSRQQVVSLSQSS